MSSMQALNAYEAGRAARREGKSLYKNPWWPVGRYGDPNAMDAWDKGWSFEDAAISAAALSGEGGNTQAQAQRATNGKDADERTR